MSKTEIREKLAECLELMKKKAEEDLEVAQYGIEKMKEYIHG